MAYGAIMGQTPKIPEVYNIGDIKATVRTDLGDKWLLCNGENFSQTDYPELANEVGETVNNLSLYKESSLLINNASDLSYIRQIGEYKIAFLSTFDGSHSGTTAICRKNSENTWRTFDEEKTAGQQFDDGYYNEIDEYYYLYKPHSVTPNSTNKQVQILKTKDFLNFEKNIITVEGTFASDTPFVLFLRYNPADSNWIMGVTFQNGGYGVDLYYSPSLNTPFKLITNLQISSPSARNKSNMYIVDDYYILVYRQNSSIWQIAKFKNVSEEVTYESQAISSGSDCLSDNMQEDNDKKYIVIANSFYSIDVTKNTDFIIEEHSEIAQYFGYKSGKGGIFVKDGYFFTSGFYQAGKSFNYCAYPYKFNNGSSTKIQELENYIYNCDICSNTLVVFGYDTNQNNIVIHEFPIYDYFVPELSNPRVYYFIKAEE